MNEYSVKICKSKFLSQQVGKLTLGLDYKDKLILDKDYFDCCSGVGSVLNYSTNQVSTCDIRTRFSHTKELFREYSDIFELKESYLFYESQNVDILFFHKIYQSIMNNNVGALLFTGSGIAEHTRSMLPINMDISLMSFFMVSVYHGDLVLGFITLESIRDLFLIKSTLRFLLCLGILYLINVCFLYVCQLKLL